MSIDPALVERAHNVFAREYSACWRPGGDEADHEDAERAAIEAVIALVQTELASVNGCLPSPKDGDPGAAPQGLCSAAPAADPSCAERSTGAGSAVDGESCAPAPVANLRAKAA